MSRLKILYFYGKEPYRFMDDADSHKVQKIGEDLRSKLAEFSEAINEENGHVAVYVAPAPRHDPYKNFNFHVAIEGVSAPLRDKIHKAGVLSIG